MKKFKHNLTLMIFILGIFMGAMDSGIISPARTVIQSSFGVDNNLGVWMITIYTLLYAMSMPITSKLSDLYGKKKVYIISIIIFSLGSILCGLTNFYGNFTLLLIFRAVQAIGGGGIMPIATAYVGESFPPEKRGTALGLVGSMYGIATILGPTLGSTILNLVGINNWGWIFFINIPISLLIIFLSFSIKENISKPNGIKLDLKGSILLSIIILSLMYALTNFNFFKFKVSIASIKVWPFLLIFLLVLPIFVYVESKSSNPILNLNYFTNKQIRLTLIISFIVGTGLMGTVFVPQFAENILKLKLGSGGYLVTLMAIFSGISAPLGGKLIDKYSAKLVMSIGFCFTSIGTLFLAFYTTSNPNFISILIGLIFVGFGMGFTMGTPLNYLMLSYVSKEESASALSTLSLIRSIGVTISPNIMVNFISEASKQIPSKIQATLPPITVPNIPGISKHALYNNSASTIPKDIILKFQNADVTNVVDICKDFASNILDKIIPNIKNSIINHSHAFIKHVDIDKILLNWKADYLHSIEGKRVALENIFQSTLNSGFKNMFVAASIISIFGLLFTLMLSKQKKVK